jgi:hypothetical protein
MLLGKIAAAVGLLISVSVPAHADGIASAPLACNAPELKAEFLSRFTANLTKLRDSVKESITHPSVEPLHGRPRRDNYGRPVTDEQAKQEQVEAFTRYLHQFDGFELKILSTTTLGTRGNFLACEMTYDNGDGMGSRTYDFLLIKDDDGNLTWRSSAPAPYEIPK